MLLLRIQRKLTHLFVRLRIAFVPRISLDRGVRFVMRPILDIGPDSRLEIGESSVINSDNRGYHLSMHSPCKFFANKAGAVIRIGARSRLHGTCIRANRSVTIGENCLIAANTQILDTNGHLLLMESPEKRILSSEDEGDPVSIGDSVWIGANCIILPGVSIGNGSVIGAGSVVTKNIPPGVVAAGNPARVVRTYPLKENPKP